MLILWQFSVGYLGETFDDLLAYVKLADITVVIDEYLKEHHRVLTDFLENCQDQMLVVIWCIAWLKELQEDGLKEHFDDILEILSEVREQAEKDRNDKGENLSFVGYTVPQESIAQMILNDPYELFFH